MGARWSLSADGGGALVLFAHLGRVSEDFLQSFFEPIDIVVDQVLPVDFTLVNQADQSQTLVHLSQVEHNVLLVVCVCKTNDRRGLFVELASAFFIAAVDASHVDKHIDQLGADLIMLHVDRCGVCRNEHL